MDGKTVLITGCSEGGLGDGLARAFHANGARVFATARNAAKMAHFAAIGIETAILDVRSEKSIQACVAEISSKTGESLDVLVNNSGAGYNMPIADMDIDRARDLFETNVWSVVAVTQAFLPLLLKAAPGSMIVNNTSVASEVCLPMQGVYSASKAAAASLTDTLRLEMQPFNIRVIELKTGTVKSKFFTNMKETESVKLPKDSLYAIARDELEPRMGGAALEGDAIDTDQWAKQVVGDLSARNPSDRIWRGAAAWMIWAGRAFFPHNFFDNQLKKMGAMDILETRLKAEKKSK